jgi:DNA-binding NarL/FixJ family response regulator
MGVNCGNYGSVSAFYGGLVTETQLCNPTTTATVKILVADDHDIVCAGLVRMIAWRADMEVVGTASSGEEAVQKALSLKPNVAILDMNMAGQNGIEATRQIRRELPECEVLLFTGVETDQLMREAFISGAKSFILKSDARVHLLEALQALAQHKPYFTNKVSAVIFSRVLQRRPKSAAGGAGRLSERELELMRRLALGDANREVARTLGVNLRTVEGHRAALMRKMGFASVADLVKYAVRNGIIKA